MTFTQAHSLLKNTVASSELMLSALLLRKIRTILDEQGVPQFGDTIESITYKNNNLIITTHTPALNARLKQYDPLFIATCEGATPKIRSVIYL